MRSLLSKNPYFCLAPPSRKPKVKRTISFQLNFPQTPVIHTHSDSKIPGKSAMRQERKEVKENVQIIPKETGREQAVAINQLISRAKGQSLNGSPEGVGFLKEGGNLSVHGLCVHVKTEKDLMHVVQEGLVQGPGNLLWDLIPSLIERFFNIGELEEVLKVLDLETAGRQEAVTGVVELLDQKKYQAAYSVKVVPVFDRGAPKGCSFKANFRSACRIAYEAADKSGVLFENYKSRLNKQSIRMTRKPLDILV